MKNEERMIKRCNNKLFNSGQRWILSHRMVRYSCCSMSWPRFTLLWSRLHCSVLVLRFWSICQRFAEILSARYKCKIIVAFKKFY